MATSKDIFGYPTDSLDEPFEAKLKKSRSLPRNLPSNDPVLTAAMAHRGAKKQPDVYNETDSPNLRAERQTNSNMQLFLPDMPRIINSNEPSPRFDNRKVKGHEQFRTTSYTHDQQSGKHHREYPNTNRYHDGHARGEEMESGSNSQISRSSRSSNLSQDDDDDMDGSLLDLADELGDEEEEFGGFPNKELAPVVSTFSYFY